MIRNLIKTIFDHGIFISKLCFNSPVTEIFPFSYFAFCLLAFSELITDIKNIKTLLKTRATDADFG